jgi:uncharacterized protein
LSNTIQEIPGLIGEKKLTTDLAMYISKLKGIEAGFVMDQKIYKLEKVVKKTNTNGILRRVVENDHHTLKNGCISFVLKLTNQ